jgi:hypothetical protein
MAQTTHNLLKNSPKQHVFWLCSGGALKNIKELASALETMDEGVFVHHVNSDRNDFANWIKDIFQDEELALRLHGVSNAKECVDIIHVRLGEIITRKAKPVRAKKANKAKAAKTKKAAKKKA